MPIGLRQHRSEGSRMPNGLPATPIGRIAHAERPAGNTKRVAGTSDLLVPSRRNCFREYQIGSPDPRSADPDAPKLHSDAPNAEPDAPNRRADGTRCHSDGTKCHSDGTKRHSDGTKRRADGTKRRADGTSPSAGRACILLATLGIAATIPGARAPALPGGPASRTCDPEHGVVPPHGSIHSPDSEIF